MDPGSTLYRSVLPLMVMWAFCCSCAEQFDARAQALRRLDGAEQGTSAADRTWRYLSARYIYLDDTTADRDAEVEGSEESVTRHVVAQSDTARQPQPCSHVGDQKSLEPSRALPQSCSEAL